MYCIFELSEAYTAKIPQKPVQNKKKEVADTDILSHWALFHQMWGDCWFMDFGEKWNFEVWGFKEQCRWLGDYKSYVS